MSFEAMAKCFAFDELDMMCVNVLNDWKINYLRMLTLFS